MSKSSSYFKKFIIIKSTVRLSNKLSVEQRAQLSRELGNQTLLQNNAQPLFTLALADAIHQRPLSYIDPDSKEHALLTAISSYFKENTAKYLNHEFELIATQGKILLASRPKTLRTSKNSGEKIERAPSVPIDSVTVNTSVQAYISSVYPIFLSNMVTSLMDVLSDEELLNDQKLKNTVLRDYIVFNIASGLNVTRDSFEKHCLPHKFERMNLFYALNFNPFSREEDFSISQLSHMRHFVYPRSDFKVLLTDMMPIGSVALGNSSDGGLSKFETKFLNNTIRLNLIPSSLSTVASDRIDLSDLASGIETSLPSLKYTPSIPISDDTTTKHKPSSDTDDDVVLDD